MFLSISLIVFIVIINWLCCFDNQQEGHTLFNFPRLVCVTGSSSHDRTDIVQLDVVQGGKGKSKESFSYLVSILQTSTLLLIFAFYSICLSLHIFLFLRSLLPCSPLGKPPQVCQLSDNRCVLWFWGMRVCGNLQTLQLSAIVILQSLPEKTNMAIVGMSLCSEFITCWVKPASIVLMDLNPHSLPLDSASGNTHVSPLFLFVCRQRVFHNSIGAAYHFSGTVERLCLWVIPQRNHPDLEASLDTQGWRKSRTTNIMLGCYEDSSLPSLSNTEMISARGFFTAGEERENSFGDRIFASTASPSSNL